ncbi:hypothetical protein J5N97_022968 [Dioscorea zingiberensis]|uniref:Uncharacterized protein n=1 Tax=Dioscorea zingiberensis TaxID=325984 RepID=A0A9D5CBJ5_9LILI|nr:hypothetical protein J5N97_022968 [Dioscorea zingiberensis]
MEMALRVDGSRYINVIAKVCKIDGINGQEADTAEEWLVEENEDMEGAFEAEDTFEAEEAFEGNATEGLERNDEMECSCRLGTVRRGRCHISVAGSIHPEYNLGLFHNAMPITEWLDEFPELGDEYPSFEVSEGKQIREVVSEVKTMLSTMGDGEISISAYDTAWVALVQDIHGSGAPQFPSSLQWIVKNQLSDGSWGDEYIFSAHDRMINTLACVIALKSWSICTESCDRGK